MSACISSRGEYSLHELDDEYTCKWCGVFDEEAFRRVNVAAAEARGRQWAIDALQVEAGRRATSHEYGDGGWGMTEAADFLAKEGSLPPQDPRDTPERRNERALWTKDLADILRGFTMDANPALLPGVRWAADFLDPPKPPRRRDPSYAPPTSGARAIESDTHTNGDDHGTS